MQVVAKYRKRAKDCRALAARLSNPADKKRLEYRAEAWAKMADLRERNLQARRPVTGISLRIKSAMSAKRRAPTRFHNRHRRAAGRQRHAR